MGHAYTVVPAYKTPAVLNQAAPVQNTWYTVLDTTLNCCVISIAALVATADETLEVKATVDGVTIAAVSLAATFNTTYYVKLLTTETGGYLQLQASDGYAVYRAFLFEGRSVKVEIRKTTATGAGNLKCCVVYAQY